MASRLEGLSYSARAELIDKACECSASTQPLAEICKQLFLAHFGLSSPPAAESVIGGTADILSGNQNRPFLTLNGHLGAVQQMAAPAPIVLMEFFERWSEYLGFIHGFSKNQLGGIVFFAGLFYMTAPMVHEVILRSRTELSALLRKFRLVKISTLSTQSMANGRSA